ncbi:DUF6248 family natural product biosynthesis protein [Streptomyces venezuelae]|uniref:DUF6248 family natural product biosynthesis protein n=1 Tax=Streptomyces venezuelae TaxID=54571 RepID=UPI003431ADCB
MNEPRGPTHPIVRRPQRTLTPEDHETIRNTALLNLQGGLIMGIIDPVPNSSPMSEDEGAWVREQVWPPFMTEIDRKYPFGFWRWSTCERGSCWNCLSKRCDLCVHRQEGGPHLDDNTDWVRAPCGRGVAKLIVRPDDAPCVWWCRCPCAKDGLVPDGPARRRRQAKQVVVAKPEAELVEADGRVRPDQSAAPRTGRGAPESAEEAQHTLF